MQILRASILWLALLVKALVCLGILCLGGAATAADDPPAQAPQLTIAQLEDLMLPPLGWKLDKKVLKTHFWRTSSIADDLPGEQWSFMVYPFWPAFFELEVADGHVNARAPGSYAGELGYLLSDALHSSDPAIQKKSALWLRQSLILYFAAFRMSKIGGQRPYAPWIKPADARRLDRLADDYIARQKIIHAGKEHEEVSDRLLTEWFKHPRSIALPDVVSYFDMLQASHESIAVDYIFPIRWAWGRTKGNRELIPYTGIDHDMLGLHEYRLLPGTLPESTNPLCLWLRDVYLSYIAGKELLEGKQLLLEDKESEPLLKEALQQWWAGLEKQEQAR